MVVKPRAIIIASPHRRRRLRVELWLEQRFVVPVRQVRPGRLAWRWMWHMRGARGRARRAPMTGMDRTGERIRLVVRDW